MTRTLFQNINKIHKELWEKSEDGEISPKEIKKTIKKIAGYTVIDKYWNELHEFDRIEQIPDTETYIVKKPEKSGIDVNKESEKKFKQVAIPEDVLKAGKQYGVNFSALITEAIIEEVSNIEQFIEDYLGEQYSEKEAEYIFEMVKNGLHRKKGDRQQQAQRGRRRRQIYKNVFNENRADQDHIKNLRQKSFELQEMLNI